MSVKKITPTELYRLQQESGAIGVIDVREREEFAALSATIATNIPLSTFDVNAVSKLVDRRSPVFLLCRSGARSMQAAQILASKGFEAVYNVTGGMLEWEAKGLPVVRG
jgi:rhodanese-related sulfurtransferase